MRRINLKHCRCGVRGGRSVTSMATADYRLMRAVVRELGDYIEAKYGGKEDFDWQRVTKALDAFNAPEKRK